MASCKKTVLDGSSWKKVSHVEACWTGGCGTFIDFLASKVLIVTTGISATAFSFLWWLQLQVKVWKGCCRYCCVFFREGQRLSGLNLLKVFIHSEIHFTIHLHLFLVTNASDILTLLSQQPALSSCCVCSPTKKSLYIFAASYAAFNLKIRHW